MRQDFARQGVGNLEAVELGLRQALLKDGRQLLEGLLRQADLSVPDNTSRQGEMCHPDRAKQVQTIFGPLALCRRYFYHASSRTGRAPLDEAFGLLPGHNWQAADERNSAISRLANLAQAASWL